MNKFVFCGDDILYNRFRDFYTEVDENGNAYSHFDKQLYDFYHLNNRDYINVFINSIDGVRNVGDVLIQKSWYTNKQLFTILNRFKLLNPNANVIVCMDVSLKKYEVFMSEVVTRQLGFIATSEQEVDDLFANNFNVYQDNYVLKKIKRKQLKKMLDT
ncbi:MULTISPECIES: hypothetical protein [unclassified Breznakia]|uniref:hypothetical protein n=1 Tax=unclassified Breznakia TaxID=2623764 RepID=UPI0024740CDD|nr:MULTISPECIES: hypothetical protein [unclassified Breznakia]MDH6367398.1 hypothetical protein [Breznakia sp. PH1-1]MDH6403930.1 hypothetical protein [Breznakia sp. PF1-11]MDH6411639.1 hypothetical protein [Breznakia sp. PFB1-11]MDH6414565.1 hypothetical protein [Breznakia sp. PFB1-14]MDH6418671.1 hypothetical protein [Breznakia sp. PFB1-12]